MSSSLYCGGTHGILILPRTSSDARDSEEDRLQNYSTLNHLFAALLPIAHDEVSRSVVNSAVLPTHTTKCLVRSST